MALTGTPSAAVTATLYAVPFYNCNTAIAVYDFLNQAWCGVDQTDYVTHAQEFLTPTIQGRQRLVFVTPDGLLRLYEDGFEDDRVTTVGYPYVDVTVESGPASPNSIQLNTSSGTIAAADATTGTNAGTTWGTNTTANARANLYLGYSTALWSAPGGTVAQVNYGLRWTSTSSTLAAFAVNGVTIKNSGAYSWGYVDIVQGTQITPQSVSMSVTTRAYAMQNPNGKAYQQATLRVATWNPSFTVTSITDGVNETAALASAQTRSRTSYAIAAPAWDATNANDDHGNPWREDYSVIVGTGFNLGSGVDPELHQESLVRLRMNQRGNSAQLRLANAQGRCVLKSVEVDAITGDRTGGTKYSG